MRSKTARLIIALQLCLMAGGSALAAQVQGRWRLVLSPALDIQVRGDLRLTEDNGRLSGTLLLETSDSAPLPVTGQVLPDGQVEFGRTDRLEHRFEGRIIGEHMYGTAYLRPSDHGISWLADRIDADADFFVPLPRFTLRQLVIGRDSTSVTLDGRWFSGMASHGLDPDFVLQSYRDAARAGGVPEANEPELRTHGYLQSMGLWRREQTRAASVSALQLIRDLIRDDTTRTRFDFLFRPDGVWLNDIHDVALQTTRQKFPHVTWASVRPALQVPGVQDRPIPAHAAMEPWFTYRLFVMSRTDSVRFKALLRDIRAVEQEAAGSLVRLLRGYEDAIEWYPRAMRFLLEAPWFEGRAPADLVRDKWPIDGMAEQAPAIVVRLYGHPDGAPRIAPTDSLTALLVEGHNWTAGQWLARYGSARLLETLDRLPTEIDRTTVETGGETFELTSVRQLRQRPSGFLDPASAVVLAPSYMPVLALETVVHEWIHVLHQRARTVSDYARREGDVIRLTPPDRFVAEGLAEWYAEVLFRPVVDRIPLMGVGEAEKRASMAVTNPDDPHLLGYLMFRLMKEHGTDTDALLWQAIRHANDPNALLDLAEAPDETVSDSTPDRSFPEPQARYLIPEVTFEIDGIAPLIRGRRLIPPPLSAP